MFLSYAFTLRVLNKINQSPTIPLYKRALHERSENIGGISSADTTSKQSTATQTANKDMQPLVTESLLSLHQPLKNKSESVLEAN